MNSKRDVRFLDLNLDLNLNLDLDPNLDPNLDLDLDLDLDLYLFFLAVPRVVGENILESFFLIFGSYRARVQR